MQSHASRHFVSEHLRDRHPDLSPPFPKALIKDEIAYAYGRRAVPKLVDVLDLPTEELSSEDRAHALRCLLSLLSNQETKLQAIQYGAASQLLRLVQDRVSQEVSRLSCEALSSLALLLQGRSSIITTGGIDALTLALQSSPGPAARALQVLAGFPDGAASVLASASQGVPALIKLINDDTVPFDAKIASAFTLALLMTTDPGVEAALAAEVPDCLVKLAMEALSEERAGPEGCCCREACAECFAQICHHSSGQQQLREAGGIPVLARLILTDAESKTVKKGVQALMGISIEKESKVPVMQAAGPRLIGLLRNSDQDVSENARAALLNSCEHPEARKTVEKYMSAPERDFFLGPLPLLPPDYRYKVILPTA